MIPLLRPVLTLCCVAITLCCYAQTDTTKKISRPAKKPVNTTKLKLTYKTYNYTSYSSTGGFRSGSVSIPYLVVNDGTPVPIDRKGNMLRRYYTKAPLANEQLDIMNKHRRAGNLECWTLVPAGIITAFSGLPAAAKDGASMAPFWTRFGIGGAMMVGGVFLKHYHNKKADRAMRYSLDLYNARYYQPLPTDTGATGTGKNNAALPKNVSPQKELKETVKGSIERNEPGNSGLYGITVNPVTIDADALNFGIGGGLGAFYTYKSLLGVSANYHIAYLDAVKSADKKDVPYGWNERGIPVDYKRATRLELQTKLTLFSFDKEASYHLHLGDISSTNVTGLKRKAVTLRLGYTMENKMIESDFPIPFATTTAPMQYEGNTLDIAEGSLSQSAAMMKSGIITAGIGWSTFRDMQIKLQDEKYKGRRAEKAQSDLFVDVLYGQSITFQDIMYYHSIANGSGQVAQQINLSGTPVKKMGFRIGYQAMVMYRSFFGTRFAVEAGLRPGPKMSNDDHMYARITYGIIFGGRAAHE